MQQAAAGVGNGSLADDALYAKGLSEQEMGEQEQALETMLLIVSKYPDGTAADRALYQAAGLAETLSSDPQRAIDLYTRLLSEYPRSTWVNPARAKIRALRGDS